MDKSEFFALETNEQLRILGDALAQSTKPSDVFGEVDYDTAKSRWRTLSKFVHPDTRAGDEDDDLAGVAFSRLQNLWGKAQEGLSFGSHVDSTANADETKIGEVEFRDTTYVIRRLLRSGDIGDYYLAVDADNNEYVLHISRNPKNNDLIKNESDVLNAMAASDVASDFEAWRYIPTCVASFETPDGAAANVLQIANSGKDAALPSFEHMHSLSEVVDIIGEDNMDIRHVGWIWRRILGALNVAHYLGVIHAGITPDSIWISTDPDNHGAVLMNWAHASSEQQRVKTISSRWRSIYPPEILAKALPQPSSDLYMAGKSMLWAFKDIEPNKEGSALDRYFYVMTLDLDQLRLNGIVAVGDAFTDTIFNGMGWKREFVVLDFKPATLVDWSWWW